MVVQNQHGEEPMKWKQSYKEEGLSIDIFKELIEKPFDQMGDEEFNSRKYKISKYQFATPPLVIHIFCPFITY